MRVQHFIAGVQKAGTSTLFGYLAGHPEMLAGDAKELHFFDDETIDWTAPDYNQLDARYPQCLQQRRRLDATPIYFFWPPALQRLQAYNPAARLVILFRDPIERAWSHWRMEAARGTEAVAFSEAIREGPSRLPQNDPLNPLRRFVSYVERGFYAEQLERARTHFPPDQMLLLKSSELADLPQATLDQVCDFFGISRLQITEPRFDHVGDDSFGPLLEKDITFLRQIFREDTIRFAQLSGLDLGDWLTLSA